MYVSQLRKPSLENNFDNSLIVLSDNEVNRTGPFPDREKVLDMVEPKKRN